MSCDVSEQVAETHGSRAGSRVGSRTNWPQRPVRAHREVLLASIPHMYWCGRSEDTTRCHRQDMVISRGLQAPVVVS